MPKNPRSGSAKTDVTEPHKPPRPRNGLHRRAVLARAEAVAHLGDDARLFQAAIDRYANAVEVADQARRTWEADGRPLWTKGYSGQDVEHPLIRTMDRLDRAAAQFGAALGLDPASAARMGRGRGRPAGAASAADRAAPPTVLLREAG